MTMQDCGLLKIISHMHSTLKITIVPIQDYVKTFGLYPLRDLRFLQVLKELIDAFIEQWQPDTSIFHLHVGEITITLDDVSALLHLPIVGGFYDIRYYTKF